MFQSTLLRRTMTLVIGALVASTFLTLVAFLLAGRNVTINNEVQRTVEQTEGIYEAIHTTPSIITDEQFRRMIFDSSFMTNKDVFLLDKDANVVDMTSSKRMVLSREQVDLALDYIKGSPLSDQNSREVYYVLINSTQSGEKILITRCMLDIDSEPLYICTISTVKDFDEVITAFINILALSTLLAAMAMLIPSYIMVNQIILPIQNINEVAKQFGQGNLSIRADETHKGEIGELGASFNILADRLSESINELTIERNRLEDIFNVISEGIVVVDQRAVPIVVNNEARTIFSNAHISNLFTERLQLIPFDEIWNDFDECIADGQNKQRTVEGPEYAYLSNIVPKLDQDGKCVGAIGFFRDIYDEQKLERTRRDYVSNISHELRTPLQTLRGLIEPLADGMVKKEEDKLRYYNIILNETMRLSRLIDDMLELSKLQSRAVAFKSFPFDINTLLEDLETKFRPIMKESGINFKVKFNSGRLPTVMGNPDRVEQVLIILLDNAKKYTPEGGSVTIYSDFIESSNKVNISVADTGQGIHEYDINHIFDRFFKADRARGKKGSGLGLSIAKELLNYMGEDITVDSTYGEGTTFRFTLTKAESYDAWK
ncbi:two-component system, OmpR family, sensor histidine kinase ResE [Ruminococcaceae bacterium YRB3002]|nr:two-component system, OmpR family, sensor histidine kinase ResE [Ruminococcaceae bacterium YRB3002]